MQILVSDIDFYGKDREKLALMEKEGMYPPRFRVVITCLSTTTHHATIVFKGAMDDLELAIPLIPPRTPMTPSKWPYLGCGLYYTEHISFLS